MKPTDQSQPPPLLNRQWVEFTEQFNHGSGAVDYRYYHGLPAHYDEWLSEIDEQISARYWWSDGFRGVKTRLVSLPPKEWLLQELLNAEHDKRSAENRIDLLKNELAKSDPAS